VFRDVTVCLPSHWLCKPALFTACSKPVEIGRVAAERAFGVIMGNDGGGGTDILDVVASRQIVGVSASVIFPFPCNITSTNGQAVMEAVDEGDSEFCIAVGTVITTTSILIHSWL